MTSRTLDAFTCAMEVLGAHLDLDGRRTAAAELRQRAVHTPDLPTAEFFMSLAESLDQLTADVAAQAGCRLPSSLN